VKRITAVLVSASALAAMFLTGSAASAAPATMMRPDNAPCTCNQAVVEPEDNSDQRAWVNSGEGGVLYANGKNVTSFQINESQELVIENGKYVGECLYYNANGGDFDALACDASKKSDRWEFGNPSNPYSEWQSLYDTNVCVWYEGAGQELLASDCNGNNTNDRWYWYSP
jgi:hypothetical protein